LRIAWYSNSPKVASGYGTQTRMMLPRLRADGHEVSVLGLYGHDAGVEVFDTPSGPVPLWPKGSMHYGLDVVDAQARAWLGDEPGWVITLFDVWVLRNIWKGLPVASWTPIDHSPVTPGVAKWAAEHPTIAMSRFGQAALADAGIESTYIPHALERTWQPTESDIRRQLEVPENGFLVMMNAANIQAPHMDRKAWQQNLRAFAIFARSHPDAIIYLHTDPTRPDGFPIPAYLNFLGLTEEQTRITDLMAYRSGLIEQSSVAAFYTAADVLLSCSMGEGFGLPVAEAMACGTPAIVTDFSAQPELVADTGWKVECEPWYDAPQRSDVAVPSVLSIIEALEEAYAERGTVKALERSEAAQAHVRAEYDADTVYAEKWRPLLAGLEASLTPAPEPTPLNREQRRSQKRGKAA
jgi:glycosyltransferase involved in cell wall biosynthesis